VSHQFDRDFLQRPLSLFPRKELPHMPGSSTTPGRVGARNNAPVHVAFRENEHVGTRDFQAFAALWLAHALPCRRFAVTLTDANARLGVNADCYSFIAVDLHHLLFAGFYRRTVFLDFRGTSRNSVEHIEHRTGRRLIAAASAGSDTLLDAVPRHMTAPPIKP
jgi:hypothetical protein